LSTAALDAEIRRSRRRQARLFDQLEAMAEMHDDPDDLRELRAGIHRRFLELGRQIADRGAELTDAKVATDPCPAAKCGPSGGRAAWTSSISILKAPSPWPRPLTPPSSGRRSPWLVFSEAVHPAVYGRQRHPALFRDLASGMTLRA
jgi:hypothetical protein